MAKIFRIIGFALGAIAILSIVLRLTGIIAFYRMPTSSMSPNFPPMTMVFATVSVKYDIGDVIVFTAPPKKEEYSAEVLQETWLKRLMGKEGDTVQLKDGFAYVNGQLADVGHDILLLYAIKNKNYNPQLIKDINPDQLEGIQAGYVFLEPDTAKNLNEQLQLERIDMRASEVESKYEFRFSQNKDWTNGNWAVIVPKDSIFVLGDNRDNSIDGRTIGFIPAGNILSKVVAKF